MSLKKRLAALERGKAELYCRFESSYMRNLCTELGVDPDNCPIPWLGWSDDDIMKALNESLMDAAAERRALSENEQTT